jgi:hypothetical protein
MWEIDPEELRNNHYWDHEWFRIPALLIDNTIWIYGATLEERVAKVQHEILSIATTVKP